MKLLMIPEEAERLEKMESAALELSADFAKWRADRPVTAAAPSLRFDGKQAVIPVVGPLMPERSDLYDFFGIAHTAYSDIRKGVADAARHGAESIRLDINSPGGYVDGLYATMDALESSPVPVVSRVSGMAASAAYMLASVTRDVKTENDLDLIGSVGVALTVRTGGGMKDFANTDSPKKRPDVGTAEGEAVIREELDDVYSVIAERIAKGRGVTVQTVNMMFGQGATMTARKALQRGMIDGIGFENSGNAPAGKKGMKMEDENKAAPAVDAAKAERERIQGIESLVSQFAGSHPAVISAVRAKLDDIKFDASMSKESAAVALLPVVAKAQDAILADVAQSKADVNKAAETTSLATPDLTGKEAEEKKREARVARLCAARKEV